MKKLIFLSMLALSFMATAQLATSTDLNFKDSLFSSRYDNSFTESLAFEIVVEEEDAPFDFNTKDYLPVGFNPYFKVEKHLVYEMTTDEEDTPFDFDTKDYLPKDFDPYKGMFAERNSILDICEL